MLGVDFSDKNLALLGHCGQNRSDGLAWSTPWCPKVDDDPLGFVNGIVEFTVADVPYFTHGFTYHPVKKGHYRRLRTFSWSANMASLFKWRPLDEHEG